VALLDVVPTLLELARIDASGLVMHGASLAGTLRGGSAPVRAIPADEMSLVAGERVASGCGSFVTSDALWLRSCTRDGDYSPDRLLPSPSAGPAPLRRLGLRPNDYGQESEPGSWSRFVLESVTRSALMEQQQAGIDAWRQATSSDPASIVSEPGTAERLRSLGYAQ